MCVKNESLPTLWDKCTGYHRALESVWQFSYVCLCMRLCVCACLCGWSLRSELEKLKVLCFGLFYFLIDSGKMLMSSFITEKVLDQNKRIWLLLWLYHCFCVWPWQVHSFSGLGPSGIQLGPLVTKCFSSWLLRRWNLTWSSDVYGVKWGWGISVLFKASLSWHPILPPSEGNPEVPLLESRGSRQCMLKITEQCDSLVFCHQTPQKCQYSNIPDTWKAIYPLSKWQRLFIS